LHARADLSEPLCRKDGTSVKSAGDQE